jgi:hypothetical protein
MEITIPVMHSALGMNKFLDGAYPTMASLRLDPVVELV